ADHALNPQPNSPNASFLVSGDDGNWPDSADLGRAASRQLSEVHDRAPCGQSRTDWLPRSNHSPARREIGLYSQANPRLPGLRPRIIVGGAGPAPKFRTRVPSGRGERSRVCLLAAALRKPSVGFRARASDRIAAHEHSVGGVLQIGSALKSSGLDFEE